MVNLAWYMFQDNFQCPPSNHLGVLVHFMIIYPKNTFTASLKLSSANASFPSLKLIKMITLLGI
jgi:hypothetical protein